jgi:hypothetical protein
MTRWLLPVLAAFSLALAWAEPVGGVIGRPSPRDVNDAITELDVARARELLARADVESAPLALERARLSLYVGDCDTAAATLATLGSLKEAAPLAEIAGACARATAGSAVIQDAERGLWIRLQDDADRALLPRLVDVAVRARSAIERRLGVVMPKPLRIDLVRDLFSLSAVSGLPLQAAETTGTVAVARWGRVNMITPRAAPGGFPWEDTLAHEITHLALSRATRDNAPLWLQEGLAKGLETAWREPRAFDADPPADVVARDALVGGQSVGIDRLGPSIAMLPSADAASIAFAEVSSFVDYWVLQNGPSALKLLLLDLKSIGDNGADAALRSVSGYGLAEWTLRWKDHLLRLPVERARDADGSEARESLEALLAESIPVRARERAKTLRTSELLFRRGAYGASAARLKDALATDATDPSLRFRLGRSLIADGQEPASRPLFESEGTVDSPHAGWFAHAGRVRREGGDLPGARAAFGLAVALDPYLEDAACEGAFARPARAGTAAAGTEVAPPPAYRDLCEAARKIPSD